MANDQMNQNNKPGENRQNENKQNESMQRQQGQSMTGERKPEQGGLDKNRENEQSREKSAIGGGDRQQSQQGGQSPSGQQGGQSPTGQSGQNKEFDKNRSEPTSR